MLCRVAEDMFWMSRYVERALAAARLIDVTTYLELDAGDSDDDAHSLWTPLLGGVAAGRDAAITAATVSPAEIRYYLAFAADNPNSLLSCIRGARAAARGVRESISSEMWEQINTLYLSLSTGNPARAAEIDPHTFYRRQREEVLFFQGMADSTLAHDEAWHFFSVGKYLERADNVARVLNLQAHLLAIDAGADGDDYVRWLTVLRSCGCAEGYARYYSLRVEPARVVEFLLLNPVFPQSVRFSLCAARNSLREIIDQHSDQPNPAHRALGKLSARLEHAAIDEVYEAGLKGFLGGVQAEIAEVSEQITAWYLRHGPQPARMGAASRAAAIMAGQQQQ